MNNFAIYLEAKNRSHDDQIYALQYQMEVTARILAEKKREQRIKNIVLAIGIGALVVVVILLILSQ